MRVLVTVPAPARGLDGLADASSRRRPSASDAFLRCYLITPADHAGRA